MDYPEPPTPPEKRIIREDFSFKFLCKIGLHKYDDRISIGRMDLETRELPVDAKEVCRRCNKIRKHVKFFIVEGNNKCQKIS